MNDPFDENCPLSRKNAAGYAKKNNYSDEEGVRGRGRGKHWLEISANICDE